MQVLTTRQCAMYKVYAYPQFFDVIAAMNAVAESVGEHSVVEVAAQAVANASRGTRVELLGRSQQHHFACIAAKAAFIIQSIWAHPDFMVLLSFACLSVWVTVHVKQVPCFEPAQLAMGT